MKVNPKCWLYQEINENEKINCINCKLWNGAKCDKEDEIINKEKIMSKEELIIFLALVTSNTFEERTRQDDAKMVRKALKEVYGVTEENQIEPLKQMNQDYEGLVDKMRREIINNFMSEEKRASLKIEDQLNKLGIKHVFDSEKCELTISAADNLDFGSQGR